MNAWLLYDNDGRHIGSFQSFEELPQSKLKAGLGVLYHPEGLNTSFDKLLHNTPLNLLHKILINDKKIKETKYYNYQLSSEPFISCIDDGISVVRDLVLEPNIINKEDTKNDN